MNLHCLPLEDNGLSRPAHYTVLPTRHLAKLLSFRSTIIICYASVHGQPSFSPSGVQRLFSHDTWSVRAYLASIAQIFMGEIFVIEESVTYVTVKWSKVDLNYRYRSYKGRPLDHTMVFDHYFEAPQDGFEPTTFALTGHCTNQTMLPRHFM